MPAAVAIPAIIGAAGIGVGAATSMSAAGKQEDAANRAADLQAKSAADSLAFQKDVFNTQQANEAPWLAAGKTALEQLSKGTSDGGQFMTPYGKTFDFGAFSAPTGVDESNDPGYAFRLAEGQKALQRSEAANGISGGAAIKAADRYSQDYASNEYSNVYNRALQNYATNYGTALGQFNTNYGVFQNDQSNQFNRLASLAGIGQAANGQLNAAGTAAAGNVAGINSSSAANIGNLYTQAGNAGAAGIVGAGNAAIGGLNTGLNAYQNYNTLQQILNQNKSGYEWTPPNASYQSY